MKEHFRERTLRPCSPAERLKATLTLASLLGCACVASGCWPFNRTPPQQNFFNALKMGNSAQASQLWLQMTPDQRAQFGRGEGIRRSVSHSDVQQAINQHYEQADDGTTSNSVQLTPDLGGGLQDLPSYFKADGENSNTQTSPANE
jgi:hypothetical protein